MIKKFLTGLLMVTTLSAGAQTVDEIVTKNIEAMGGAAKLNALSTAKWTGNMSAQGLDFPITMTKEHMKGMRLDLEIMGTSNYQIVTPDKGFMFFPIQQMTEPKELDAETVAAAQSQLDIRSTFLNYKEKGTALVLMGIEKVNGEDAYRITSTTKTGKVSSMFIDVKNNRLIKVISKSKGPDGVEAEVESSFSDYKQNADGYWFAHTNNTTQGTITFEKVETNIKVDPNIFKN